MRMEKKSILHRVRAAFTEILHRLKSLNSFRLPGEWNEPVQPYWLLDDDPVSKCVNVCGCDTRIHRSKFICSVRRSMTKPVLCIGLRSYSFNELKHIINAFEVRFVVSLCHTNVCIMIGMTHTSIDRRHVCARHHIFGMRIFVRLIHSQPSQMFAIFRIILNELKWMRSKQHGCFN